MKTLLAVLAGLIILLGIISLTVKPNPIASLFGDPQSYYAVKFYRSAVRNEATFRTALHKADWRREMKFRKAVGDPDVPIPDDPADDPPSFGEIKQERIMVAGYVTKQPNWGAQVTQRAGFKSLQDLEEVLAQISPTPAPTP